MIAVVTTVENRQKSEMMRARATILILSVCAWFASLVPTAAEVIWDATRKSAQFPQDSDQAVVLFRGRTAGSKPLTIVSANPTCDCATASIETAQAGGEYAGLVRVVLTRSTKHPNPASAVKVTTSDGASHLLTIEREGTAQVKVVPALVWWNAGSAAEEREFIVQTAPDTLPILKLTAEPTSANFTCVNERLDSRRWRIRVKPRSTEKVETATVRCEITRAQGDSKEGACVVSEHLKIARP